MPTKRIRDRIRGFKPQATILFAEWKDIEDRSIQAEEFFKNCPRVAQMLETDLSVGRNTLIEDSLRETKAIHVISETVQRIFTTPKAQQVSELVGQVKYIKDLLSELKSWIALKADLEQQEADGKITIQREQSNG